MKHKIEKQDIRKLEKELKFLCDEMISNINKNKEDLSIGEIRKSKTMWCELATL